MLTRKEFLDLFKPDAPPVHEVAVGEDIVYVREMSAHERSQFDLTLSKGLDSMRERLVVLCACDFLGTRLFTDADTTAIGQMPFSLVEPIFAKAREVNGFVDTPTEETRKNSESNTIDV